MASTQSTTPKKKLVGVSNVAVLLMGTIFIGQILGFLRTKLVNANFPIHGPHSTDAYFAAFIIPDFFFFTLSAGALGVALMPVLSDRLHKMGHKSVWELSVSVMNMLAIVMTGVGFFILIFAHWLIAHVVAPHMSPEQINNAATIMRFVAFDPLLFTISGILTAVQQTFGRFFFYAIAPLFYNLSIIISIFIFKDNIGLVGLGIGAVVGALAQLIVIAIGAFNLNFHWHPRIMWRTSDFRTVLRNLPPRSLDQGMDQVEDIVETHIASGLGSGAITNYNNAYILSTAPIMLLGTAISTAAFPKMNSRLSQGRPDLFRKDFLKTLRTMIWITAPVVIACYYCRGYLARLIYSQGNDQIAIIFGFLSMAILFRIIYTMVSRWFYSNKDTRTPLLVSVFAIALNIVLAYALSRPSNYGVAGLAIATSIVAAVEVSILSIIMVLRDHKLFDKSFIGALIRIMSVSGFTIVAGFIMISLYPLDISNKGFFALGSRIAFIFLVIFAAHVLVSALFDLEEVKPIFNRIRRIVLKPININT